MLPNDVYSAQVAQVAYPVTPGGRYRKVEDLVHVHPKSYRMDYSYAVLLRSL